MSKHNDDTNKAAQVIIDRANEISCSPNKVDRIIQKANEIMALHQDDTGPEPGTRVPVFPHIAQWLYSLYDQNESGYRSRDGGKTAATTLHLGAYPRADAKDMIRRCKELGHTHVVVCARAGLDAQMSFGVNGTFDWLADPADATWFFDELEKHEIACLVFGLDDDDVRFNESWDKVKRGWARFLDHWGHHPLLSGFLTGIEVDETWGEQSVRPQSAKTDTIRNTEQRVAWLHDNYPDLPIGDHYGSDTMLWLADFAYYQAAARNHDDQGHDLDLRGYGNFRDEFGPSRRGGESKQHNIPLYFAESADKDITPKWIAENQVAGAHQGLIDSNLPTPATGMGQER